VLYRRHQGVEKKGKKVKKKKKKILEGKKITSGGSDSLIGHQIMPGREYKS
jgi:hypothetical protein